MYEPVVTSDNFDYAKDDIGRYILKNSGSGIMSRRISCGGLMISEASA